MRGRAFLRPRPTVGAPGIGAAGIGARAIGKILISACLLGQPVRYDGSAKAADGATIERWRAAGLLVTICPELAAGFGVPRPPAEIAAGRGGPDVIAGAARVVEISGRDVTADYVAGAHLALNLARAHGCRFALLTDGSPSCGSGSIHDGSFTGTTHNGMGVTTALLEAAGIQVFAHHDIARLAALVES